MEKSLPKSEELKLKKAVWITQPRFALGINRNKKNIREIINHLNSQDYLVIDEATEQLFPSFLNEFNCELNIQK